MKRVVTCAGDHGPETVLDGFTITGGDDPIDGNGGAGMLVINTNPEPSGDPTGPTVKNCIFTGNTAEQGPGGGMYNLNSSPTVIGCTFDNNEAVGFGGGGMCNNAGSDAVVRDCVFKNNRGDDGGGMGNRNDSDPTITNCEFTDNTATLPDVGGGGGMYNNGGNPTVTDCTFTGNSAGNGGGIANVEQSAPMVTNCDFRGNSAVGFTPSGVGGGMYNDTSSPTVSQCTFLYNDARYGAGIYSAGDPASPAVTNCTFTGNNASDQGGGIYNNLCSASTSSATITNCLFSGNAALNGGGIGSYDIAEHITITNCTFAGNSARIDGGGVWFEIQGRNSRVDNCVFWENVDDTAEVHGGPLMDESAQLFVLTPSTLEVSYTDIMGLVQLGDFCRTLCGPLGSQFCCNGSIDDDPAFIRAPDDGGDGFGDDPETEPDESANDDFGNLRLTAVFDPALGSPCIDAADNDVDTDVATEGVQPLPLTDLDGNSRFVNDLETEPDTGNGTPPIVDMGAYEFNCPAQSGTCPADLDADNEVGASDLAQLLGAWGLSPTDPADFNCDTMVGAFDLAQLLGDWGPCP